LAGPNAARVLCFNTRVSDPVPTLKSNSRSREPANDAARPSIIRLPVIWGAIIAGGFLVRMLASRGEMWIDEVLSLDLARAVASPWRILFDTSDNNHLLNTLVLYLWRGQNFLMFDRLHSVIAGTAAIALACVFARRWGNAAATFAALLFASSFLFIEYASEARGYAMLVCFTLMAMLAVDRGTTQHRGRGAVVFGIACTLGILAHSLFIQAWIAMVVWWFCRLGQSPELRRGWMNATLQFHLAPLLVVGVVYLVFIRKLNVLGAEESTWWNNVLDTAALTLGTPREGWPVTLGLVGVCAIMVIGIVILIRRKRDEWVLLLMMCVIAPALVILIARPGFILPRYFMIPITGIMLLLSYILGELWRYRVAGRLIASLIVAAIIIGNSRFTHLLLRDGRSHYIEALRFIADHTPGDTIRMAGDHDFRHIKMVTFYRPYIDLPKSVQYFTHEQVEQNNPEWVLAHSFDFDYVPATPVTDRFFRTYELQASYPTGPLAGWRLFVYRQVNTGNR
jgi:uncharacterized membrane protein